MELLLADWSICLPSKVSILDSLLTAECDDNFPHELPCNEELTFTAAPLCIPELVSVCYLTLSPHPPYQTYRAHERDYDSGHC